MEKGVITANDFKLFNSLRQYDQLKYMRERDGKDTSGMISRRDFVIKLRELNAQELEIQKKKEELLMMVEEEKKEEEQDDDDDDDESWISFDSVEDIEIDPELEKQLCEKLRRYFIEVEVEHEKKQQQQKQKNKETDDAINREAEAAIAKLSLMEDDDAVNRETEAAMAKLYLMEDINRGTEATSTSNKTEEDE